MISEFLAGSGMISIGLSSSSGGRSIQNSGDQRRSRRAGNRGRDDRRGRTTAGNVGQGVAAGQVQPLQRAPLAVQIDDGVKASESAGIGLRATADQLRIRQCRQQGFCVRQNGFSRNVPAIVAVARAQV